MFEAHEIELDTKRVLRLPVLEGLRFKHTLPRDYLLSVRVARPKVSKDVFEYRSAQAMSPMIEEFFFDQSNRLVGRRVPQHTQLSEIAEDAESIGNVDFCP